MTRRAMLQRSAILLHLLHPIAHVRIEGDELPMGCGTVWNSSADGGIYRDPKEIPTRRWSERVSEARRIHPKHRGASVSAAWRPGELPDQLLDCVTPELRELVEEQHPVVRECSRMYLDGVTVA